MAELFASIDAMILLAGFLVAGSGGLLGTFLVLRGAAMLTDAIAHAILLGIVVVWLVTGATSGALQIFGAAMAGLATVLAASALARTRLVATDAAIGLVFTAFFATGVLLINLFARDVHIDLDAVLLGEIGMVWLNTMWVAGYEVPLAVVSLAVLLAVNLIFVVAFWKELVLASFDPGLAAALGLAPVALGHALMALTSATAVAAFDAVGVVLFVAFVTVPAATALLLTDRPARAVGLAVGLGMVAVVAGHQLAVAWDIAIAPMMAVCSGVLFAIAVLAAPRHGVLVRSTQARRRRLRHDARVLVAHLATHEQTGDAALENTNDALRAHLRWPERRVRLVLLDAFDRGFISRDGPLLLLTDKGRAEARALFEHG